MTWTLQGNVTGPQGPAGPAGSQGPQGLAGSAGPAGAAGPIGPQGPQGPSGSGAPGSTWFSGAGAPSGATGIVGDFYLDTSNDNVHKKTAASTWTFQTNIRGAAGAVGSTGAAGATGPAGAAGAVGPSGPQGATGAAGPTGPQGPAGAPGANFRGPWSSATTYAIGDAVSFNGSSFISLVAGNANNNPATSPAQWGLLAAQGAAGPAGAAGAAGATGATGATGPAGPTGPQGPQGPAGTGGGSADVIVRLTADINSPNAFSYVDATGLSFLASANTDYLVEGFLIYTTPPSGGAIQLGFNGPSAPTQPTFLFTVAGYDSTSGANITNSTWTRGYGAMTSLAVGSDVAAPLPVTVSGVVRNGANIGTVILRYGGSAAITLRAGSLLRIRQLN